MPIDKNLDISWDDLIFSLADNKIVLFVGPKVVKDPTTKMPLLFSFYEKLAQKQQDGVDFNESEQLFIFSQRNKKSRYAREILINYEKEAIPNIYEKIAQIPFNFIISLTPDHLLKSALEKYSPKVEFKYYSPKNPNNTNPNLDDLFLLNIFGSLEDDRSSIVLSYDDMFDFLKNVLSSDYFGGDFNAKLREAETLIFLGFDFEKWYTQILLRVFELNGTEFYPTRISSKNNTSPRNKQLTETQFDIKFIDQNIEEFIDTFLEKCKKNDEVQLRTSKANEAENAINALRKEEIENLKAQIKELNEIIKEYNTDYFLEEDHLKKRKLMRTITKLKAQKYKLEEELKTIAN